MSKRSDLLLLVLGLLGLGLFLALYDEVFPSAALDLALSREQIAGLATEYMAGRGYDLEDDPWTVLTFDESWLASVYLQRTLGVPQTNELVRQGDLPLWYWQQRWFEPSEKQEFRLSLMPDGTVIGMGRDLLEDAPGADLAQEEARALAEAYLVGDRGWDLAGWDLVTAASEAQPGGRRDHYFEWKQLAWDVEDSELMISVDVQGESVDGYDYWLHVPEAFVRDYAEDRDLADFIDSACCGLGVGGFGLVALLFYVLGHRRGIFPRHEGLKVGLLAFAVSLAATINALPLYKAYYDTTQSYALFWINQLAYIFSALVVISGMIMVLWAGGRYLARRVWPLHDPILPRGDDPWISLGGATWRGLALAGISAGYLVLFYWITTGVLGGWTPIHSPPVNLFATPLPALAALRNGLIPALNEELVARLVGIGLLLALTRNKWLALLIPGLLWAFAHSGYVSHPIYTRGVELTFVALLYGLVFLRYGLATTIVAHMAYNAGLTALPLLRAGQPGLVANGLLIVAMLLLPLLIGAVRWLYRRLRALPSPSEASILPATERELPALARLDPGRDWAAWLADPAAVVLCLVGDQAARDRPAADGEPAPDAARPLAGVVAGRLEAGGLGRLSVLHVAPAWRRHYWGSRLAHALELGLSAKGARRMEATVPAGAWPLARFWDTLHWSRATTTYVYTRGPALPRGSPAPAQKHRPPAQARRDRFPALARRRRSSARARKRRPPAPTLKERFRVLVARARALLGTGETAAGQTYAATGFAVPALDDFRRGHPPRHLGFEGLTWEYISLRPETTGQPAGTVLFLHGMAGAYDIWWQQIEALRDRYHLISVTYPPVPNLAGLSRGLMTILNREGVAAVSVVGSSMGGYLAQYLVARYPGRVQRALFANTFPPNKRIARRTRLPGLFLPLLPRRLIMAGFRVSVERRIYPAAGYSELVHAYLLEQSRGAWTKAQFIARYRCIVEPFAPPDPEALGIPVQIVEADNDPLVEAPLREMLKSAYPSARVHTLSGVGHFAYLNEPRAYTRLLEGFLAES